MFLDRPHSTNGFVDSLARAGGARRALPGSWISRLAQLLGLWIPVSFAVFVDVSVNPKCFNSGNDGFSGYS